MKVKRSSVFVDDNAAEFSQEQFSLPDPNLFAFYADLDERVLWVIGEIDEATTAITRNILAFNREDSGVPVCSRRAIRVMIYSPGGNPEVAKQFYDVVQVSQTPVYTYNMGMAASAAFDMLISGHKRYALPHSYAMLHAGAMIISANFDQVKAYMKNQEGALDESKDIYLSRTEITAEQYEANKEKDWYFNGKEQLEYGVVDELIESLDQLM